MYTQTLVLQQSDFFSYCGVALIVAAWLCHSTLPCRVFTGSSAVLSGSQLKFGPYYRILLAALIQRSGPLRLHIATASKA